MATRDTGETVDKNIDPALPEAAGPPHRQLTAGETQRHQCCHPEVAGRALTHQQSERPKAGTQPRTGATAHWSTPEGTKLHTTTSQALVHSIRDGVMRGARHAAHGSTR